MTDLMFAHLPTRLELADRLGAALGLPPDRLLVKRDDCTGLATGVNKARKLELVERPWSSRTPKLDGLFAGVAQW